MTLCQPTFRRLLRPPSSGYTNPRTVAIQQKWVHYTSNNCCRGTLSSTLGNMGCTLWNAHIYLSVSTVSHQRKLQRFKLWLLCNACNMQLAKCSNSRYGQNDYLKQSVAHAHLIKITAQCLLLDTYLALWVNLNIHSTLICLGVAAMVRQH
jgi:uncharacterized membrane protein